MSKCKKTDPVHITSVQMLLTDTVVDWAGRTDTSFLGEQLDSLSDGDATSLHCEFNDSEWSEVTKALESRVCEFVSKELDRPI